MKSRDFCYWLQGFFELSVDKPTLAPAQVECIQRHLALVFKHEIDPEGGDERMQEALNALHSGKKKNKTEIGGVDPNNPNLLIRC
jgi:hypothetical protein